MKTKLVTLLLATAMAVTTLAGCGNTLTTSGTEGSSEVSQTQVSVGETESESEVVKNFNAEGYPIVNEEITLKILLCVRDVEKMIAPEEMPLIQRLEEETGIKTEWEVVKASDFATRSNLIFASKEYPDVIMGLQNTNLDIEEYGVVQGILLPLDDLIDQYMPNFTSRLAEEDTDPTVSLMASDGQKYSIPYVGGATYDTSWFHCINQEWLDALKLETPTDVEGLTEVLRAFKTKDPNGNGKADEIPMVANMVLNDGYGVQNMLPLFGIPATTGGKWLYIDDNKQVQPIPTQKGFRECMEWLHMCYQEGLLDPEVISQDVNVVSSKLKEGTAGFYTAWAIANMGFDTSCVLYVPNSEQTSICSQITIAKPSAAVTCTNENVEATMRWFDALLEEENMWSGYYGEKNPAEGCSGWIYGDDGMVYSVPASEANMDKPLEKLSVNGLLFMPSNFYNEHIYVKETSMRAERTAFCKQYKEAGVLQKYSNQYFNLARFTTEQVQANTLLETDLNNAVTEFIASCIVEGVTDNKWDTFVSEIEKMGIADYVKMYQDGFDALGIQ